MSGPRLLALLIVYIAYLLIGGFVFQALEGPLDCEKKSKGREKRVGIAYSINELKATLDLDQARLLDSIFKEIQGLGTASDIVRAPPDVEELRLPEAKSEFPDVGFHALGSSKQDSLMHRMEFVKANPTLDHFESGTPCSNKWDFYNAFFFSFTAVTTIGYGHLSPDTEGGKVFCIFYSLLGVPINGILIGNLGKLFGTKLRKFRQNRPREDGKNSSEIGRIFVLFVQVVAYLIPGLVVFILGPSIGFYMIEDNWSYLDSVYYSFITLTTIGFGDFVAGRNDASSLGSWRILYEMMILAWITFGLGYVFMIITIIADGISLPARKAADKFKEAEKQLVMKILKEIVLIRSGKLNGDKGQHDVTSLTVVKEVNDTGLLGATSKELAEDVLQVEAENQIIGGETYADVDVETEQPDGKNLDLALEEFVEDLNRDTVTSLHSFVSSALLIQRTISKSAERARRRSTYAAHSFPDVRGDASSETRPGSRALSIASNSASEPMTAAVFRPGRRRSTSEEQDDGDAVEPIERHRKFGGSFRGIRRKLSSFRSKDLNVQRSMSSAAFQGKRQFDESFEEEFESSAHVPQILRDVTLEEILEAMETVRFQTGDSDNSSPTRGTLDLASYI